MPRISLIRPLNQPPGARRLPQDLNGTLHDTRFSSFKLIIASAKSGPSHRSKEHLDSWRSAGHSSDAILGIDQHGTSEGAPALAPTLFDSAYVTQAPASLGPVPGFPKQIEPHHNGETFVCRTRLPHDHGPPPNNNKPRSSDSHASMNRTTTCISVA